MLQLIPLAEVVPGWVDEIVLILIEAFGAALVLLAVLAVRKLGRKWGIEGTAGLEEIARANAQKALNLADRWARNRDEKPSAEGKLEQALDYLIELEAHKGVTDDLRARLARRIEVELEIEAKEDGK